MNTRHILFALTAIAIPTALLTATPAQAATSTDFAGRYDLEYTQVHTNLLVTIDAPNRPAIQIPVVVDEQLVNEALPDEAIEPMMEKAAAALVQAGVPESLQPLMLSYIEKGLIQTVAAINEQALQLPDELNLTVTSSRLGTVTGVFTDQDVQGTQPYTLPGTILVSGSVATLELLPVFSGSLDANAGFIGTGDYSVFGLDVSETIKGVAINVSGDLSLNMDLQKLAPVIN